MTTSHLFARRLLSGVALLSCVLASAPRLEASCNQIPGVTNTFRGAHGTIDRPFASPADPVDLRLSPTCDADASFDVPQGLVISVIFTPLDGPRNVVVMAPNYAGLENDLAVCAAQTGVSKVTPLVTPSPAGPGQVLDPLHLRFLFPQTDTLLDAPDDARTLSGPATIAVTPIGVPLPCGLATTPCTQHPETLACIDALYAVDGSCGTAPEPMFAHFTALPLPNDYAALTAQANELRLTIDSAGNVLLPMDWSGILVFNQTIPVERLLRGSSGVPAFPGGTEPIRIPGSGFLQSFSPEGSVLAPTFEPQSDPHATHEATFFGTADAPRTVLRLTRRSSGLTACTGGSNDGRPCGTAADCPTGTCGTATCASGTNAGQVCHADSDCPGGECGPSLFDFRSRVAREAGLGLIPHFGPGVCQDSGLPCTTDASCGSVRCVGYRMVAEDAVPLDGLIESPDLRVTVVPEAIDNRDLDGDGDAKDEVLLLANRHTGEHQPIGVAPAPGRAVTRIHAEPFSSPALAVEDDIVAFLEGEPLQGNIDVNGDGDVFDTPLRILRSGDDGVEDLLPAPSVMANAEPVINGASVVISDGLVFVRVSEMDAAHRTIVRASVTAAGGDANGASGRPSLSKDARQVAFESTATNLTADAGLQSRLTSYVVDLRGGAPQAVRLDSPILPSDAAAIQPWLSGDGRYVAVAARDSGGVSQVFVYDRDHDNNGVFDESGGTATVLMSRYALIPCGQLALPQCVQSPIGNWDSLFPFITPSGRFVAFDSYALLQRGTTASGAGPFLRPFLVNRDVSNTGVFDQWERDDDHNGRSDNVTVEMLSVTVEGGATGLVTLQPPTIAASGTVSSFVTFDRNLANGHVTPDLNDFCLNLADSTASCADVLVRGADVTGRNRLASYSTAGVQANNHSLSTMLANDGRSVAYTSAATNLVPGDTNGAFDVFVNDISFIYDERRSTMTRDRVASDSPYDDGRGTTTRVSVASDGTQANGPSFDSIVGISDEGRYVAFASTASNLVPNDSNNACDNNLDGLSQENCSDIFIHDRVTGFTQRASATAGGADGNGASHHASLSGDGRTVAFESTASNLVPNDHNDVCDTNGDGITHDNCSDVFVAGPDRADPAADFNGDGDASDTLLEVFDTRQPGAGISIIAPAGRVAIVGERAAFLSPEQDSETDLNGDGDTQDSVVELYTGRNGRVINLQRAARSVALSEYWLAALVSEADEERDLNGNGTQQDLVVQVTAADGTGSWTNLGISATRVEVAGDTVAFTTLENVEGKDLNGDGDKNDLVLQLYDARTGTLINTGQAVGEFVLVPGVVAFTTREAAQGNQDLNGDGDTEDFVMQVYDVRTGRLINTGQAASPCVSETCDPRRLYTLTPDSVTFQTLERQQGQDLNGDGNMDGLVLQTFNIAKALAAMDAPPLIRSHLQRSERRQSDGAVLSGVLTILGAVSVGICSDTGNACAGAADCGPNAHCYLPPGGCVTNLHTACDTTLAVNPCGEHQYCVPKAQGRGECSQVEGSCTSDADCTAPAHCQATGQSAQRLISPLFTTGSGRVVFTTAGSDGRPAIVRASDTDGDGIADPFDNCPHVANADQADTNGNGVGDACEASLATPSPTAVATATPVSSQHDEGCAVGPTPSRSVAYAVLLGACLLWGLRRRGRGSGRLSPGLRGACTPLLALALITLAAAPAVALETPTICAGDCDNSDAVTIDELVTLVNIALGTDAAAACTAGDLDADGSITIDEILAAVGRAMNGCPVPAEQLAGGVMSLAHGLSYLPLFEPVLSAYFSAAGGNIDCPSGGTLTSACEDSGGATIRIPIVAAQCAIPTFEGTATIDGITPLVGTGLCPSVLVPGGWQMACHSSLLFENPAGGMLGTGRFDLAAAIESLAFGAPPCRLRGGAAVLDGTFTYALPDGGYVTLTAAALHTAFQLDDLSLLYTCQPATISLAMEGEMQVVDAHADPPVSVRATLHGLTVTIHRLTGRVEINGGIVAEWAGGNATLATVAALLRPLDQPCFTGGTLNVEASGVGTQLTFGGDGSVSVDRGADGSIEAMFGSCLDAGLQDAAGMPGALPRLVNSRSYRADSKQVRQAGP